MFTGIIQDDKILGWYNFNSEGKNSVRQMIFRIAGDSLIEGYGSIETNHDTAFFKDITTLNYLNQRPLIKVACDGSHFAAATFTFLFLIFCSFPNPMM